MIENRRNIVVLLEILLKQTRAGKDIKALYLDEKQDEVLIVFENGYSKKVNIEADSGIAVIRDVLKQL